MRTLVALVLAACAHANPNAASPAKSAAISPGECELVFGHVMAVNMGDPDGCVLINGPLPPCELTRAQYQCLLRARTPTDVARCP